MRKARAASATNSTCSSTGPWLVSACGGRRPVLMMGDWEESFKPAKKALSPPRGLALALLGLVWSSPGLAQSDQRGTDDLREAAQNPISKPPYGLLSGRKRPSQLDGFRQRR